MITCTSCANGIPEHIAVWDMRTGKYFCPACMAAGKSYAVAAAMPPKPEPVNPIVREACHECGAAAPDECVCGGM